MNTARLGRRMAIATLTVLTAGTLAACGTDSATGTRNSTAAGDMAGMSTPKAPSAGFNDADVAFAQMMIPDHRMVADMSFPSYRGDIALRDW
jgi:uncharacterized protein (DUF305 family)